MTVRQIVSAAILAVLVLSCAEPNDQDSTPNSQTPAPAESRFDSLESAADSVQGSAAPFGYSGGIHNHLNRGKDPAKDAHQDVQRIIRLRRARAKNSARGYRQHRLTQDQRREQGRNRARTGEDSAKK
ncbi:MAG: hypothetical protein ACQEQV_04620 [Fibrobacterota bacterium]